ncbi:MAG: hypothetical protein ACTSSB_04745 [Candidatus Heimdallarchaeota archaeon]
MSESEVEPKTSFVEFFRDKMDKKYYWGFGIGTLILVVTIILIYFLKGDSYTWLEIFAFPLIVFFITQQVLSGFGFITGYIPIAQYFINWLTKGSKKKPFSEKEVAKWEKTIQELEEKEDKENQKIKKKEKEADKKEKAILENKESGKWKGRKLRREEGRLDKLQVEIADDKKSIEEHITKEKNELKELQKQYRGKFSEKIISRQEDLEPRRFKLIMLVPLYVMLVIGLGLAIFSIVTTSIHWAVPENLNNLISADDKDPLISLYIVNEIYKGIMAVVSIVFMLIVPSIRALIDPAKEFKVIYKEEEEKRRRFAIFRRRRKKDHRSLLNRQFEDLRKYYWSIKQRIKNALLIPIGMSMLIVAPLGGTSIVLGAKTTFQRKRMERYELILQIILAAVLIGMVATTYFSFFARFIRGIPFIALITKLIYMAMLILSFVLFTRQPIAELEEE